MTQKDTLFIIELNGVIFNAKERFKRATKDDGQIDWSMAFDPDLLQLDTLMPESVEAIEQLASRGNIIYLTRYP